MFGDVPHLSQGATHLGVLGFGDHLGAVSGSARTAEELVLWRLASMNSPCMWWRCAGPAVGTIWSSPTSPCATAGETREGLPRYSDDGTPRALGLRVSNGEETQGRHRVPSASDDKTTAAGSGQRELRPDDRLTAIIAPVRDDPSLRDPVEAVKAALDAKPARGGRRRPPAAVRPAAVRPAPTPDQRSEPRHRAVAESGFSPTSRVGRVSGLRRRPLCSFVLPILTFVVLSTGQRAPKPGDIRTNQVSTIYASDGSELAKNRSAGR